MKKVILMAVIAAFAGTTLAFAGSCDTCGSCGAGEAKAAGEAVSMAKENNSCQAVKISACGGCGTMQKKAAGEGSSHDAENMAEVKAEKGNMHKAKKDGIVIKKSNISIKTKAKEASSY